MTDASPKKDGARKPERRLLVFVEEPLPKISSSAAINR